MILLAWAAALCIAVPVTMLAIECAVGSMRPPRGSSPEIEPPFTVLIPAHDEASGIAPVIKAVQAQMRAGDQLIVIADNCIDQTADIARAMGATVVERVDPARRGKGYALEAARNHVDTGNGRAVIVVDADCFPQPGALRRIAAVAMHETAVVQGTYLLSPPPKATAMVRISCFAFLIKNRIRQRALQSLAGVCLLQGTGMAFPQAIHARIDWGGGSLVEDLDLGIRLLTSGDRVVFDERALFVSPASSQSATIGQRQRWEHGMMASLARSLPLLLKAAIVGHGRLVIVALDQVIPPTVVLLTIAGAVTLAAFILWLAGAALAGPLAVLLATQALLTGAISVAWWHFGRAMLPPTMLGQTLRYAAWKLPMGIRFFTRREARWVRTDRDA
ncbi:glycosyltransferase family 2 protein [Sphingomonas sp. IW22]|uniref:glycosyltransferase family 2 protein n=1 Tax=Sphingomonas sp. IW22 TaxID=3242489 RepID=UPI003520EE37